MFFANLFCKIWTFNLTGLNSSAGQFITNRNILPPYTIAYHSDIVVERGYQSLDTLWNADYPAGSILVIDTSQDGTSGQLGIRNFGSERLTDFKLADDSSQPSKLEYGQALMLRVNTYYSQSFSKKYGLARDFSVTASFDCENETFRDEEEVTVTSKSIKRDSYKI